ncbi:MAG TPA: NAD(P)H-dependent oxidoreductase [Lachnospiraceae bacterium]|nr:NAD(P)H-dependent oxidoreductase [Lachnospiraceae bacterium]
MHYLVISTLPRNYEENRQVLSELAMEGITASVMYEEDYHIEGCKGCTFCWLRTPGRCVVKDDYEILLREMLKADVVIFLSEAKLGFVSYRLKNIIDRIIPMVEPYVVIRNGECRHIPRYEKRPEFALVYTGEKNGDFLNQWLACVTKNMNSTSIGAYHYEERQVFAHAVNNI